MFRCLSGLMVIVLGTAYDQTTGAQEVSAARQFGAGVHDFYQGRYFEAIHHLDGALAHDARDPRAYFFRGLAKQRVGWTGDAAIDFRMGSQLEVALKRRDVGQALQRIQGPDRLLLEQYRREARQLPEAMVRNVIPQPAATTLQRSTVRRQPRATRARYVPSELPADTTDPFGEEAAALLGRGELQSSPQPTVAQSATTPAPAFESDDPFADDFAGDAPFGSGVADETAADESQSDTFAADTDMTNPATTSTRNDRSSGGIFGAMLRALSPSVAPAAELAEQGGKLLQGARGATADQAAPQDDATELPAADPFADPFDAEPATERADPPDETGETDDPFADDDDPFSF
jgi:hypothetical protein